MSCSEFIEHEDEDKSDTLVIIVNGDGTVTVDPQTLERVLTQQCRAAVSFVKIEDTNEPDSQTDKSKVGKDDKSNNEKEPFCHKVNLVVEGYYPPPPSSTDKRGVSTDSIVSSTVGTPPLRQTSSEFMDLLSEGLEISSNAQTSSNAGGIRDSLVDAFSEMAPEQLKQVETALHSEKAKQILGDDVTSVLDTLKMTNESDDWVHLDHCYTTFCGHKKEPADSSQVEKSTTKDSDIATSMVLNMNLEPESPAVKSANSTTSYVEELCDPVHEIILDDSSNNSCQVASDVSSALTNTKLNKKKTPLVQANRTKGETAPDAKMTVMKKNIGNSVKNLLSSLKEKRPIHRITTIKRKNSSKNENVEQPPERIVKEDEVDGVKVFKPTRNDKRLPKTFQLVRDISGIATPAKAQLVQSKLNFTKKEETVTTPVKLAPTLFKESSESISDQDDSAQKQNSNKNPKKESQRKSLSVTPETFGPALFSTPDIIRKIGSEETPKDADKSVTNYNLSPIDTADLEKRMSAIENGETFDSMNMQYPTQSSKQINKNNRSFDDSKLLSDLENSADENNQIEEIIIGTSETSVLKNIKVNRRDSVSDLSVSRDSVDSDKSEGSDRNDVEYEDDPNKLWCICNKPHNNRFMICCDACDNWFHGYCVGITKAMGEKMEQKGTEWLCPSCKKEKSGNERESKSKLSSRNVGSRQSIKRQSIQSGEVSNLNISNSASRPSTENSPSATSVISTERHSSATVDQTTIARRKSSSQLSLKSSSSLCVVCKENEAMLDALYCGNDCIAEYVDKSIETMNRDLAQPLPEDQKIIVWDKKRDQRITGMRAPSVSDLKEWLAEHPAYEIVKPSAFPLPRSYPSSRDIKSSPKQGNESPKPSFGKPKDIQINADNAVPKPQPPKHKENDNIDSSNVVSSSQTSIKQFFGVRPTSEERGKIRKIADSTGSIIREGNVLRLPSTTKKDGDPKLKEKRQIKLIPLQPMQKQVEEQKQTAPIKSPVTPVMKKSPTPVPTIDKAQKRKAEPLKKEKVPLKKPEGTKKPELKRQDSKKPEEDCAQSEPTVPAVSEKERIRSGIRKSLNELFTLRLKDVADLNITAEELNVLANEIEEELFNLFNDTGPKYKAKYRSLRFNIKDEKNNLFRRIAEKSLKPRQLVRLTPEELASTELAQWREREAKHEIDMIKKTELENLSQAKVLVLKTHKGELEIEKEALPPVIPDMVVPDMQPDEIPPEVDKSKKSLPSLHKEKLKLDEKDKTTVKSSEKKGKDYDRQKKHDHKDRHKSRKHRHRSSEREQHRSRSRRRSKSGERTKNSEKDSRNSEKRGHKSRSVEKDESRKNSEKKHDSKDSDKSRDRSESKRRRSRSRNHRDKSVESKDKILAKDTTTINKETEDLSSKESSAFIQTPEDEKIAAELLSSYNAVDVDLSDMEPTSTVTIQTPPYVRSPELPHYIWKGILVMPDVIKFHTILREVSGNCEGLDEDLPSVIDCVGRINPNTVWDYISKTKKSGSREILVLRFEVLDEEQRMNYLSLYSYLNSKNRMAVVGNTSSAIKDFYVIPLAGHSPVPQVLLPLDGPGFEDSRSHMLLGVIVRSRRHSYISSASSIKLPTPIHPKKEREVYVPPPVAPFIPPPPITNSDTFTPPHSPTSVFVNSSIPSMSIIQNDDDEPYSPEDDDEPYSPSALDEEHNNQSSLDLQREMEALNRKIEEQKQQIESISSSLPQLQEEESAEFYSPTENFSVEPEPTNVQLPGDLQQLLNSLNKRSTTDSTPISQSPVVLQTDPIINSYKSTADEDNENELVAEPHYSPPEEVEPVLLEEVPDTSAELTEELTEIIDENKVNRDPRRKPTVAELFRASTPSQPPPPGMEDEFGMNSGSLNNTPTKNESIGMTTAVSDSPYSAPIQAPPYVYPPPNPTIAPFAPALMAPVPPMYITAPPPVYPQPAAIPYAPLPTPQMYIQPPTSVPPPATIMPADPSMIPLPVEINENSNPLKRKVTDDRDRDSDEKNSRSRKSPSKGKKHYRDSKSPPGRHKSSSYDSRRRSYHRDDDDYSSGSSSSHSRYGHKHDRNYRNRSRSSYWKSGNDYSSSSSRRKYAERDRERDRDRRSSSRERSSSRRSWENPKPVKEDWDSEIQNFETQKRDNSDSKKIDSSTKKSDSSSKRD